MKNNRAQHSQSHNEAVSRREFLKGCVQLSCVVGLVSLAEGCGSEGEPVPWGSSALPIAATANNDGTWTVAGAAKIEAGKSVYFTLPPENLPGVIFAAGLSRGNEGLRAFSTKCPHAGCAVTRQPDGFRCPCHSSEFSRDGKPLSGPAKSPLTEYSVRVKGEDAIVAIKS